MCIISWTRTSGCKLNKKKSAFFFFAIVFACFYSPFVSKKELRWLVRVCGNHNEDGNGKTLFNFWDMPSVGMFAFVKQGRQSTDLTS